MPMVVPLTMPSLRWPSSGPRAEHKADNRALAEKLDRLDVEEGLMWMEAKESAKTRCRD